MERMVDVPIPDRVIDREVFEQYFPVGHIKQIDYYKDSPSEFQRIINWELSKDPNGRLLHYTNSVIHRNGDISYIAHQDRSVTDRGGFGVSTSERTDIWEYDSSGKCIGRSSIQLFLASENIDSGFRDSPFVTWTESKIPNVGLGLRRYFMMNALYMATHNLPLCSSGILTNKYADSIWRKLEKAGLAFRNEFRYCFQADAVLNALSLDPELPLKRLN